MTITRTRTLPIVKVKTVNNTLVYVYLVRVSSVRNVSNHLSDLDERAKRTWFT